ncbi:histidine kinase [Microvirga sp. 3-52]|nr:histidine kinase [Microvirga sp. 3-52]
MATLFRLVIVWAILTAIGFAAMYALATLVQPDIREIVVPIPADRLPRSTR